MRRAVIALLTASLGACAAKAQVRTEVDLPLLDPPPPPPRVVAAYEPEPAAVVEAPPAEPTSPARPAVRQPRQEPRPETATVTPGSGDVTRPSPPPSLTLTLTPGSEAQTVAAIRDLLVRATRDLSRVNASALSGDGRAQFETARRFIQQAEEALKSKNIVFAGKLADKAATMAAVLGR
jgi:hypothetical protein